MTLPAARRAAAAGSERAVVDSQTLFKGGREVRIQHNEETYRLTITKLGKLILTK
ncbi:hemin uptake protein HemP [Polymorphum gilvum]|uniref:hemin uptake protein HemP n=1 Tax=Polymorphum gilvum TaxID=991904 RepID=UPI0009FC3687|nr:hemin uptake protein HemP [Polymorphum gilvum]